MRFSFHRFCFGNCAVVLGLAVAGGIAEKAFADTYDMNPSTHVRESLTDEQLEFFDLFVYVDKAEEGPFAQHMYVFEKENGTALSLLHDWPVSTGREELERDAHGRSRTTGTPAGFYAFDPQRFFTAYQSRQWNEPMPYAMFFNGKTNGHLTGLAIHGVNNEEAEGLGRRASAGCVRLSIEHAHALYDLMRTPVRNDVPGLLDRPDSSSSSSDSTLLRDTNGDLQFENGLSALVLIDDFKGGSEASH